MVRVPGQQAGEPSPLRRPAARVSRSLPIAAGGWLDGMDQDAPDFSSEASSSATGTITGPGHR